jgi:hypothetical protein
MTLEAQYKRLQRHATPWCSMWAVMRYAAMLKRMRWAK